MKILKIAFIPVLLLSCHSYHKEECTYSEVLEKISDIYYDKFKYEKNIEVDKDASICTSFGRGERLQKVTLLDREEILRGIMEKDTNIYSVDIVNDLLIKDRNAEAYHWTTNAKYCEDYDFRAKCTPTSYGTYKCPKTQMIVYDCDSIKRMGFFLQKRYPNPDTYIDVFIELKHKL